MIGVTIGVGIRYAKAAKAAAACLKKHAGIDSIILSEDHFTESGLDHPAALKLSVFSQTKEDDVLYYDADWFCVSGWNPEQFAGRAHVVGSHDFVSRTDWPGQAYGALSEAALGDPTEFLRGDLRTDYIDDVRNWMEIRLAPSQWLNTGLFIVNRMHHAQWLSKAEHLYRGPRGHHPKYFEQPAMIKALEELSLRVEFLPRRFNVLVCSDKKWPRSVIGLHVKLAKHVQFTQLLERAEDGATPEVVEDALLCRP